MDDENPMFRTNTHFADFADEDAVREAQEKFEADQKMTAEERARKAFEDSLEDDEESIELDSGKKGEEPQTEEEE